MLDFPHTLVSSLHLPLPVVFLENTGSAGLKVENTSYVRGIAGREMPFICDQGTLSRCHHHPGQCPLIATHWPADGRSILGRSIAFAVNSIHPLSCMEGNLHVRDGRAARVASDLKRGWRRHVPHTDVTRCSFVPFAAVVQHECPWIVASSGKTGLKLEDRVCRSFQNDSVVRWRDLQLSSLELTFLELAHWWCCVMFGSWSVFQM
jgi:hypothetical protein